MGNDFTAEDDENLAIYLSFNSRKEERLGDNLYQKLVLNQPERWPWSARHSWSAWLRRYNLLRNSFDLRIRSIKIERRSARSTSPSPPTAKRRTAFTPEEDKRLVSFLAQRSLGSGSGMESNRSGNVVYRDILVANLEQYPWAATHPWQSWRNRYIKRSEVFDRAIAKWQKRHGINPETLMSDVGSIVKAFTLKEGTSKAGQLSTKRRKHDDEVVIADNVQADHPLPKKLKLSPTQVLKSFPAQVLKVAEVLKLSPAEVLKLLPPGVLKLSPAEVLKLTEALELSPAEVLKLLPAEILSIPREHGSDESTKSVQKHLTTSPISDLSRSPQVEAEVMAILGANSNHQGPSEVNLARDKESPRRNVDDECQQGSANTSISHPGPDKASPVQPVRNEPGPSSDPSVRIPTNTPRLHRQLNRQPTASPRRSVTYNVDHVTHISNVTPMVSQFSGTQLLSLPGENAKSTESLPTLSHAVENASTTSIPDISLSVQSSPARFPGDHIDARDESDNKINGPKMLRQPFPQQSAVDDSHHPTPPSVHSRSDASVHHLSMYSGSPTVIVKDEEKSPSTSAQRMQSPPKSAKPPLFALGSSSPNPFVESPSSARNTVNQQSSLGGGSRAQNHTGDNESISDGPFASTPPSPRRAEVIRGLPRLRQGTSFRDAILVRDRKIIAGNAKEKGLGHGPIRHKRITNGGTGKQETMPTKLQEDPTDAHKRTEVRDVFDAHIPVALDRNNDPFVLSTANLPESSIASSVSSASLVPRNKALHDKGRRRTFAGFKSRSSIPNIDLVEKLHKRTSSRSSAILRNRRASLDTTNLGSVDSTSPTFLTSPENRIVRYRPSRASAIPIRVDTEYQHTSPALLDKWSPSTRNLVVQAGLASIFKRMEENHGFCTDVVRRAWLQQNMDLDATDRMLLRMRIAAENASHGDFHAGEDNHGFSLALGRQNVLPSHAPESDDDYTPPARSRAERLVVQGRISEKRQEPNLADVDYTPPARSRAEHYQHLIQGRAREQRQNEPGLVSGDSLSSCSQEGIVSAAVWTPEEDEILRTGDEDKLQTLAEKFGEDAVRRRFVAIMREVTS